MSSERQTTNYYVTGMKCDGCIANAISALGKLPGYEGADFDLKAGTAMITGNVDPQAVCQALHGAGYPTVVKSD